MDAVLVGPSPQVIAERQRLGLDRMDEVWDGDYHMAPAPTREHQRCVLHLAMALVPAGTSAGLEVSHELNLIPCDQDGWGDYRVPDLVAFRPEIADDRGVVGEASLVVEVRSPGDESLAKVPFYERLGVGEVVVIDRDTKAVRRWTLAGVELVEQAPDRSGRHHLRCLPVVLETTGDRLVVDVEGQVTTI